MTRQNRLYSNMSIVTKNITVEVKFISLLLQLILRLWDGKSEQVALID